MDYRDIFAFIAKLREREAVAALALEFTILTATRCGEILGARWSEIDLDAKVWTIPAQRMKAAREHRVPLSEPALAILAKVNEAKVSDYVFPGQRPGKPLSVMALEMVLRRMGIEDATTHGFRSAFRDWAGNETHFPRELAEHALAHVIGDRAEQAYRRSDALARRREVMDAWANYCQRGASGNVVSFRRPA
jgi:integrase